VDRGRGKPHTHRTKYPRRRWRWNQAETGNINMTERRPGQTFNNFAGTIFNFRLSNKFLASTLTRRGVGPCNKPTLGVWAVYPFIAPVGDPSYPHSRSKSRTNPTKLPLLKPGQRRNIFL